MSDAFFGEIRMFGGSYAPRDWATCDGQVIPIGENTTLYSIMGNMYGGDGRITMGVPNLLGRAAVNQGTGPGLSNYRLATEEGYCGIALTEAHMPEHDHLVNVDKKPANTPSDSPANAILANSNALVYTDPTTNTVPMAETAVESYGLSHIHENRQPSLSVLFILCMEGLYPSRN